MAKHFIAFLSQNADEVYRLVLQHWLRITRLLWRKIKVLYFLKIVLGIILGNRSKPTGGFCSIEANKKKTIERLTGTCVRVHYSCGLKFGYILNWDTIMSFRLCKTLFVQYLFSPWPVRLPVFEDCFLPKVFYALLFRSNIFKVNNFAVIRLCAKTGTRAKFMREDMSTSRVYLSF